MLPGGGQPDMGAILAQAQQMQQRLMDAQRELAEATVTGTAGGGLVTATISGTGELTDLALDPKVVDPEDVESLTALIIAAVRDANTNAQRLAQEKMGPLSAGGMDLGGMLPGF